MYDFVLSDFAFSMHHPNSISYHLKNIEIFVRAQHTKMTKNTFGADNCIQLCIFSKIQNPYVDAAFAAYCVASQNMEMTFE